MSRAHKPADTTEQSRRFWHRLSIKQTRAAVVVGLTLGLLFGGFQILLDVRRVQQETEARFEQILLSFENAAFQAAFSLDPELSRRVVDGLFHYPAIKQASIEDNLGTTLAQFSREARGGQLQGLAERLFGDPGVYELDLGRAEGGWVVGRLSFSIDSSVVAEAFLERSGIVLLSGILPNLILAVVLAVVFHAMLTRPLAMVAQGVSREEPEIAVPPGHENDDLGELVRAYNEAMDRKRSGEEKLRESEQRFAGFTDAASDWFWELDADLRFAYVSERFYEITDTSPAEILGQPIYEVMSRANADAASPVPARLLRLMQERKPLRNVERALRTKRGREYYALINALPYYGSDGAFAGYRGTGHLITARKGAELALQNSELRLRTMLDSASMGIVVLDSQGRIASFNPAAERVFGYTAGEVVGRSAWLLFWPPEGNALLANPVAFLSKRTAVDSAEPVEVTGYRKGGESFPMQLGVGEMRIGDEPEYVASVADLSLVKALENELSQAQKLDSIGKLTGGVAHDMNNILGIVTLNLELAQEVLEPGSESRVWVDQAFSASERGARLTHRLLAFARRQPLAPRSVDPAALILGMEELLRRSLGEDIDLQVANSPGLWRCSIDPGQLENTLINLAVNARDAMSGGGQLTIESSNASFDEAYVESHADVTTGEFVCIAVTDTGEGMTRDVMERAFDPFFTTKEQGRGTGLGLSMVHGFIKQSGGHVRIYSERGEGTTIKLYLPSDDGLAGADAPAAVSQTEPSNVTPAEGRGERILVVEDDAELRDVITTQLASLGFDVDSVAEAAAALERLARNDGTKVLLTDVVLTGGMSGRELSEQAQTLYPDLLVVYMSGYTENAIMHQGRLDEGVILLQKPFRRGELARTLRKVLDES